VQVLLGEEERRGLGLSQYEEQLEVVCKTECLLLKVSVLFEVL